MAYRTTRTEQCLRCGSFDMIEGIIHDAYYHGKSPMRVWIDDKPVQLRTFICRSCGHIEQLANFDSMQAAFPGKVRACPKCDAVYSYQKKHEVSDGVVKCQNCGVEFHLSVQVECPHCSAAYLYSMERISSETIVPCQNCGKNFYLSSEMDVSKHSVLDGE